MITCVSCANTYESLFYLLLGYRDKFLMHKLELSLCVIEIRTGLNFESLCSI